VCYAADICVHVSVDCALVPLTRAMLMALNPFLCSSVAVVSVIFVAVFLLLCIGCLSCVGGFGLLCGACLLCRRR